MEYGELLESSEDSQLFLGGICLLYLFFFYWLVISSLSSHWQVLKVSLNKLKWWKFELRSDSRSIQMVFSSFESHCISLHNDHLCTLLGDFSFPSIIDHLFQGWNVFVINLYEWETRRLEYVFLSKIILFTVKLIFDFWMVAIDFQTVRYVLYLIKIKEADQEANTYFNPSDRRLLLWLNNDVLLSTYIV